MEQPNQIKCYLCSDVAEYAFAYACLSDREAFFGVIHRGVCQDCLTEYIDKIKKDRQNRGELFLWPVVFLPIGALLVVLSKSSVGLAVGYCLLGVALAMPIFMRIWQRRESRRTCLASVAENETRYCEQMCREDALRTSRQTKLVYLRQEYAEEAFPVARIAKEASVSLETAALLKKLAGKARIKKQGLMRDTDRQLV